MLLHQLLTHDTIRVGLPGSTKAEVIDEMLDLVHDHPAMLDFEQARQAVLERESSISTGVGKGLGLPHGKTSALTETIAALAVTANPIDFDAIDGNPVRILFLMVGPETAKSQHIRILSRISRLINRDAFRERLLQATTPQAVMDLLEEGEMSLAAG